MDGWSLRYTVEIIDKWLLLISPQDYRCSTDALLNRGCDITKDGKYVHSFKSDRDKKSVSLGALSIGRIGIVGKVYGSATPQSPSLIDNQGINACRAAATIGIRYSAVRKQFGPPNGGTVEWTKSWRETNMIQMNFRFSVILFNDVVFFLHSQLQSPLDSSKWERSKGYRGLFIDFSSSQDKMVDLFAQYMARVLSGEKSDELVSERERRGRKGEVWLQAETSKEVHGLSSCCKPRATWLGVNALAEARAACGGHGWGEGGGGEKRVPYRFLYISRLNELRDTYDPSQTFEGENNILVQQASNYLLSQKKQVRMRVGREERRGWMNECRVSSLLQWAALTSYNLDPRLSEDGRRIHFRVSKGKGKGILYRSGMYLLDWFRCVLCIRMAIALHSE